MDFEWDEEKRRSNLIKHGIDFADAVFVFVNQHAIRLDERQDYGERRGIAVGYVDQALLVVVFTDRANRRRIISARRGGKRDHARYQNDLA